MSFFTQPSAQSSAKPPAQLFTKPPAKVSARFFAKGFARFAKAFPKLAGLCILMELALPLPCALAGDFPEISADEPLVFDEGKKALKARGRATLKYKDHFLGADELYLFEETGLALAEGSVYINTPGFRALADTGRYDLHHKSLEASPVALGNPPFYMTAPKLHSQGNTVHLEDSTLYMGTPDPFCINLHSRYLDGVPGQRMVGKHNFLAIGKFPIFYIPKLVIKDYPFEFTQEYGTGTLGTHFKTETAYRPADSKLKRLGLLLDGYDTSGIFAGPTYDFASEPGGGKLEHSLRAGHLYDRRTSRGKDFLGRNIPKSRFMSEFRGKYAAQKRFKVITKFSYWTDPEILRQTRPQLYSSNQAPDSFMEAVYLGNDYSLSAFTRVKPNSFLLVQQRLPELQFHSFPKRIGKSTVYQEAKFGLGNIFEKKLTDNPTRHVYRLDGYYGLSKPIPLDTWISIVPQAGLRVIHYGSCSSKDPGNPQEQTSTWVGGEVGLDIELKAYNEWAYENPVWEIQRLRHICKPVFQYRMLPVRTHGNPDLASIDRTLITNHLDPLEIVDQRKVETEDSRHILRLGLNNLLQTRSGEYGSKTLSDLYVFQDLRLKPQPGKRAWADTHLKFSFTPAYWLSFSLYDRLDPYRFNTQECNASCTIKNVNEWSFTLGSHYYKGSSLQYSASFVYNFTSRHTALVSLSIDQHFERAPTQTYQFKTRLGHNWDLLYTIGFRKHTKLDKKESYTVVFQWHPI